MTNEKATPASAPEPSPSSKKGFTKEWKIATTVGAVALFVLWMLGSMGGDGKDIISSVTTNKPAPTQVVAGNTASSTASTPVKGNIIPASTTKAVITTPATGDVSTAKVDVKAEGGRLLVKFDPCCNCKTASVPPKAPTQSRKPATPPVAVSAPAEMKAVKTDELPPCTFTHLTNGKVYNLKVASDNPLKVAVTTGAQCRQERERLAEWFHSRDGGRVTSRTDFGRERK